MLPLTAYQQFSIFRATTARSIQLIPRTIRNGVRWVFCQPNDQPIAIALSDVMLAISEMKATAARRYVRLESAAHAATVAIPETSIRLQDLCGALERTFGIDSVLEAEPVLWTFWDICCAQHYDMAMRPGTRRTTELRLTIQYVAEEAVTEAVLGHRAMVRSGWVYEAVLGGPAELCDKMIAAGSEIEKAIQ